MNRKMKRTLLIVPVWVCLITLSIIRTLFCIPKVKYTFQKRIINRISTMCQRLYGLIRNPFQIRVPMFVPKYFLQEKCHEYDRERMERLHECISKNRAERGVQK